MGKPYPQIVQDIFLSPFLFFYISNMPNFASSKTRGGASRPANTPRQACSLDCITKLRFAFQPAPAGKTVTPYISLQPATVFRPQPADTFPADFLQSTTLSGPNYLPPGASRPTTFRRISFHTSTTILRQSITSIPAWPASIFPLSFFLSFSSIPLHAQKKGNRQSRFPSLFFVIPNLVQI